MPLSLVLLSYSIFLLSWEWKCKKAMYCSSLYERKMRIIRSILLFQKSYSRMIVLQCTFPLGEECFILLNNNSLGKQRFLMNQRGRHITGLTPRAVLRYNTWCVFYKNIEPIISRIWDIMALIFIFLKLSFVHGWLFHYIELGQLTLNWKEL